MSSSTSSSVASSVNEKTLRSLEEEALARVRASRSSQDLEEARVHFLGKKGKITEILQQMKDMDPEERKKVGPRLSELRSQFEAELKSAQSSLTRKEMEKTLLNDSLDSSAPGVHFPKGASHPVRQILTEAVKILQKAGLAPIYGPEVEYEEYCFDRLNFKPGHAARDMQATFFVKNAKTADRKLVLRTHTSPMQVRALLDLKDKAENLPIRLQIPGRVYRCDDDATHSPMFHQIEGIAVDTTSTMGDLRAVLDYFFRQFFEDDRVKTRFRPSYFPFTEPSAEVDVSCVFCSGKGCKTCKHSGWIEIAGAGLIHPEVFELCGWNPQKVQGWAFGMGVERLTMLKLGVPDLRLFFENRLSFLRGRA